MLGAQKGDVFRVSLQKEENVCLWAKDGAAGRWAVASILNLNFRNLLLRSCSSAFFACVFEL